MRPPCGWQRAPPPWARASNLRGLTGASVIAIDRGGTNILFPPADEVLGEGDALVLTGTDEGVDGNPSTRSVWRVG